MEQIEKQYKIKKFFKLLFRGITEEEYIRVFQNNNKDYSNVKYFNDIDELVSFASSNKVKFNNTYFTLATTDGKGGSTEHLMYRYFLGFDFDKKDQVEGFNHIDILNKFKSLQIHYNCLIDSGNGYHVYICIERTNDLQKVKEVQEALCDKLGADKNAIKTTQILRIPYTFNIKNGGHRQVNIIYMEDRNSKQFKPYNIDFLYQKNCNIKHKEEAKEQTTFTLNNTNVPECIKDVLTNGTKKGDRYTDLQRIVVLLRQRNKSIQEIKKVCKEWATKSNFSDNLDYRIENIYNNLQHVKMECKECEHKRECYNSTVSDFEYDKLTDAEGNKCSVLKYKNTTISKTFCRGDNNMLGGNEIIVLNVLKNNNDGLFSGEIEKKITFKKKCRLSKPTLIKTLKTLEEMNYITVTKGYKRGKEQNFYKVNRERYNADNTIEISYFATIMCICRLITPSELRLYYIMRYLHAEQQKNNTKALKGNLFQINQEELAQIYYGKITKEGQGHISDMINNLIECHILDIWERATSQNNGYNYNIYRLNS